MLLKDFIKQGASRLEQLYPSAEARNIILMLCEYRLGTKNYTHIVEPQRTIDDIFLKTLEDDLERLSAGEPVQYVLGFAEFCGHKFKVTPDVLIPRPETEILCQEAMKIGKAHHPVRILDLCTGSGCIAWTLALGIPGAEVIGIDISERAVAVAREQDFDLLLKERGAIAPKFIVADVLEDPARLGLGEFDLILSNPPYIMESQKDLMRANVLDYEPPLALFVPDEDPLIFYKAVAGWARNLLSPEGKGIVEINELSGKETLEVFSEGGFPRSEIIKDFSGKDRFVLYSRKAFQGPGGTICKNSR